MSTTQYAIIDAAAEPDTLAMLDKFDPVSSSLYLEPLEPEIARLAPYLVQIDESVSLWLKQRKSYWGFYFESRATFKEVRQHWRKYLQVMLPEQEKPVFFRFYDPRNLWLVCDIFTDWELHGFLGPVETLMTTIDDEVRREDFNDRRQRFPRDSFPRRQIINISDAQFTSINQVFERRYIEELSNKMQVWQGVNDRNADVQLFAEALFYYLRSREIDDKYQVETIAELLIKQSVDSLQSIPSSIADKLANDGSPGWFRANKVIHGMED